MHGRWLALSFGLLGLAWLAGCNAPMSPRAQRQLDDGLENINAGDDSAAVSGLNVFIRENRRSKYADEGYYLRGYAHYNLAMKAKGTGRSREHFDSAKADLEEAVSKARTGELRAKAAKTLGDLSYETGDMVLAEQMYRQCISNNPPPEISREALYRLGCALQRQERWAEATRVFNKVIDGYPGTREAKASAGRVHAKAFTVQAGSFTNMPAAQRLASRLKGQNLPAHAEMILQEGRARHVVQVGRFARSEQAEEMLRRVLPHQADAFVAATR